MMHEATKHEIELRGKKPYPRLSMLSICANELLKFDYNILLLPKWCHWKGCWLKALSIENTPLALQNCKCRGFDLMQGSTHRYVMTVRASVLPVKWGL
jgi:hypothetical protein